MELLYEFVPDGNRLHCFNLTAVDDTHIESIEYHEVWLLTVNHLDKVTIHTATIRITDNDGKFSNPYSF